MNKVKINKFYKISKDINCNLKDELIKISDNNSKEINIDYNGDGIKKINKIFNK